MKKFYHYKELEFLKNYYPDYGLKYCSKELGRSLISVRKKVYELQLKRKQKKSLYEEKSFSFIVKESKSFSEVTRKLGLFHSYGNRQTVKKYIKKYDLNIEHFDYGISNNNKSKKKFSIEEILIKDSIYNHTTHLKEKLYKLGLKKEQCEICGQNAMWMNKKMSLIIDHINGDNCDNRIENLRIVCPNCNATLDTFSGKNIKHKNENKLSKQKNYCDCGSVKECRAKRCINCHKKSIKNYNIPELEILLDEVKTFGYCNTGRKYNVSDNTIRKWIKNKLKGDQAHMDEQSAVK